MGMIRKTLSIGTLGLVSWRSKSERLELAEASLAQVETARDLEAVARTRAEARAAGVVPASRARALTPGVRFPRRPQWGLSHVGRSVSFERLRELRTLVSRNNKCPEFRERLEGDTRAGRMQSVRHRR